MKSKATLRNFLAPAASFTLALIAAAAFTSTTHAATLYFDGGDVDIAGTGNGVSAGGVGTWNTTIQNWDAGAGNPYVAWNNANGDNAVITGSATITIGEAITVGTLTFTSTSVRSYTLSGSEITINNGMYLSRLASLNWTAPIKLGGNQTWTHEQINFNSTGKNIRTGGTTLNGHTLTWDITNEKSNNRITHSDITGTGSIIKNGTGWLGLGGTNTYAGNTTINAGTIDVVSSTALGNANNQLTVNTGGTLNMSNRSLTVGNLTGTGGVITSTHTSGNRTLTIGSGDSGGGNFQGVIEDGTTGSTTALTKTGNGSITLSGVNTYTGATTVAGGTLSLGNGTNNSNLADFAPVSVDTGAKLNLNFSSGNPDTVLLLTLGGTPLAAGQYGHTNSGATNGGAGVGAYDALFEANTGIINNGSTASSTTTLVIDLGAGTQIPGGAFGTFGALNLPIPPLPVGSILRSLEVNTVLTATDNGNFASDLVVLFDPTPATPGDDFSVVMTSGTLKFGAPVQLGWTGGNSGPPTPLVDTKIAADWAAAGTIDLATTGIFLGNAFNNNIGAPDEGGTWSGTITLTYDVEATGTPYEDWATGGELFDGDANGDGVSNGLAFLLGATGPNVSALEKLPTLTESAGGLVLSFQMLDATARGGATLALEHSNTLSTGSWTTVTVPDTSGTVDDVVFNVTGTGPLNVTATIPVSKAAAGKLFGRLKAVNP